MGIFSLYVYQMGKGHNCFFPSDMNDHLAISAARDMAATTLRNNVATCDNVALRNATRCVRRQTGNAQRQ